MREGIKSGNAGGRDKWGRHGDVAKARDRTRRGGGANCAAISGGGEDALFGALRRRARSARSHKASGGDSKRTSSRLLLQCQPEKCETHFIHCMIVENSVILVRKNKLTGELVARVHALLSHLRWIATLAGVQHLCVHHPHPPHHTHHHSPRKKPTSERGSDGSWRQKRRTQRGFARRWAAPLTRSRFTSSAASPRATAGRKREPARRGATTQQATAAWTAAADCGTAPRAVRRAPCSPSTASSSRT